eukprot:679050-Hanusia_phi.AAC.2
MPESLSPATVSEQASKPSHNPHHLSQPTGVARMESEPMHKQLADHLQARVEMPVPSSGRTGTRQSPADN